MLTNLFPRTIDNTYRGQWLGLALFCLVLAMKLIMSVNSIANTHAILTGADGIPLDAYGADAAQAVLSLFGVLALSQLALASVALIALVRYRAMIPLMLLVLLVEHCARRVFLMLNPIERPDGVPVGFYINLAIAAALLIGFLLSIWTRRSHRRGRVTSPQTWARVAGLLYVINIATGVFALVTTQGLIVANDAAQTAANIAANEQAFRLAFAAIILAGVVYVAVIAILYVLMKPAGATLSAIAAFMGLAGCAIGASTGLNQIAALSYLGDASYLAAFSQEQLQVMARLSLRAAGIGNTIALVFFGFYCLLLATLVFRARFLPRWLGVLLLLAGVGWLVGSFSTFLMPSLGIAGTLIPVSGLGEALFTLWLLVMGVNATKWREQAAT